MTGGDPRPRCIEMVAAGWRARGVMAVALRAHEELPTVRGDLDVLIRPGDRVTAEAVLSGAAARAGFRRYARVERSAGSPVTHRFFHTVTDFSLVVDLFTDLNWRSLPYLDADRILAARRPGPLFDLPRPGHEAAAWFVGKLLHGSGFEGGRAARMNASRASDPEEFLRCLAGSFGMEGARRIERLVSGGAPASVPEVRHLQRLLLARALAFHPLRTARGAVREVSRVGRRLRHSSGLLVVLLGPDGSGKSTIAVPLLERLGTRLGTSRRVHFHWKPGTIRPERAASSVAEPYARPARSRPASWMFLAGHWAEFLVGSWLRLAPLRAAGAVIVGERYYHDMLLDPARYRLVPAHRLAALLGRAVLRPDAILCLVAPTEVVQARKSETSPADTDRQLRQLRELHRREPRAVFVEADAPPEVVRDRCEAAVLEILVAREERRSSRGAGSLMNGGSLGARNAGDP